MTSPDLKKLITGFLLLAAVTSSSAFFLSNTINTDRAAPAPQAADTQPIASAPRSPFVEQLQETNAAAAPASVPEPPANLTDALADEFAKELLRVNPDGPQDTDGGLAIVAPDIEVVIKTFTQNQRVSGTIEAWDREVESLNIDVREQFSPRDVQIYAAAANAILTKRLVETGLADALVAPSANTADLANAAVAQALKEISSLSVPGAALPLHKSLLTLLVYQKKVLELAGDTADPLAASLALQTREEQYNQAIRNFENESQKFAEQKISFSEPARPLFVALFADLLAVKQARAQFFAVVHDPVFNLSYIAKEILKFAKSAFLQALKTRLVQRFVQQVITWVQGGGRPQFVTNWRGFLADAANVAAGDVIYRVAPNLCRPFGPLIRLSFQAPTIAEAPVMCTLDQVVQNIEDFANDFRNGGWIAYGATLEPKNNFFGALIETHDLALKEAVEAQEAAKNKALAGSGYLPTERCVRERDVDPYAECLDTEGSSDACTALIGAPARTVCDEYETTTPGKNISDVVSKALSAPIDQIVNANDITSLIGVLINSAVNRLINLGSRGLLGLGGGGDGSASPSAFPDPCAGLSGSDRTDCRQSSCAGLGGQDLLDCEAAIAAGDPPSAACQLTSPPPTAITPNPAPLPNRLDIVQQVASDFPNYLANSCQDQGGTWEFMDEVVGRLHAQDERWGYLGQRGNVNDLAQDAITYYYGSGSPTTGSREVYGIDIIGGHCGTNPSAAWFDVSCFDASAAGAAYVFPR
ncbi:MAG: hypothetical protein UY96_C0019G0003 [Parcubacteria group bacterium GW2011_GWB1_56_8]|nr:MAG: hypothetical protein UY96_C0019G0003 [Parcubacteria group bacterium GW2011_GWB1_56_8]